ncbi:MAG TPA: hypothetical protein VKW08_10305 [Xanthobacteraceae bacterium]|jgi:hypothetical protein|nr:hypothetical protein [Xanthobacteraceae bacterium]
MSDLERTSSARIFVLAGAAFFGIALLFPGVLVAQSPDGDEGPVRVGDIWVYDTKDEVAGYPKATYSELVTEVSAKEILTEISVSGSAGSAILTYDPDWNRIDNLVWRFKPNDGQGISLPLAVGKTWRAEFDSKNNQTSLTFRGSSLSKVTAREAITTAAGTFQTFKIERQIRQFNTNNPARHLDSLVIDWYSPQINHWVRRTFYTTQDKRVRASTSEELTDFSRKL